METILSDKEYFNIHNITNLNTSPDIIHFGENAGDCKVCLYDYDVDIPHLHLKSINKKFEICICLLEPKYYSHGGRFNKILNNNQLRILNKFMNQRTKNGKGEYNNRNYWDLYIFIYNNFCLNNKFILDSNKIYNQPDYNEMKSYF